MALKKPWTIKPSDPNQADRINQNIDTLYKAKLESRWSKKNNSAVAYIFQVMESGKTTDLSANGSATMVLPLGFHEKHGTVIYAQAHSTNPYVKVNVTDVTQTGLTLTFTPAITPIDGSTASTATVAVSSVLISSVVTGTWSAWYMAVLSDA